MDYSRHHPVSRRGKVGTVDNGGPGGTSTAVVVFIRQRGRSVLSPSFAKGDRLDSDDLRITEHRAEKPDTQELPSRVE